MIRKQTGLLAVLVPAFWLFCGIGLAQAASKTGEQVECKDGTLSKKGRGACSGHGGVASQVSTSTAGLLCKDGTTAKKGKGACSHHGGVAGVMSGTGGSAKLAVPDASPEPSIGSPASRGTAPSTSGTTSSRRAAKSAKPIARGTGGSEKPAAPDVSTEPSTGSPVSPGAAPSAAGATSSPPAGESAKPIARCKDGTMSYSAQHEGACSHQGGVDQWLDKK